MQLNLSDNECPAAIQKATASLAGENWHSPAKDYRIQDSLSREAQRGHSQNVLSAGCRQENLANPHRANLYAWASSHENY